MTKFDGINALDTLFSNFVAGNVSNLAVKPDFMRNVREATESTFQLFIIEEDFVPLASNGTYRDERYNIWARLQTTALDDNTEQVFRDIMKEYDRLIQVNHDDPDKDADFDQQYKAVKETSKPNILFIMERRGVLRSP